MEPASAPAPVETGRDLEGRERRAGRRRLLPLLAIGVWALLYCPVSACLALWMTYTEVLVASEPRPDGLALACRYFTGAGVEERLRPYEAGEPGLYACPPFHITREYPARPVPAP